MFAPRRLFAGCSANSRAGAPEASRRQRRVRTTSSRLPRRWTTTRRSTGIFRRHTRSTRTAGRCTVGACCSCRISTMRNSTRRSTWTNRGTARTIGPSSMPRPCHAYSRAQANASTTKTARKQTSYVMIVGPGTICDGQNRREVQGHRRWSRQHYRRRRDVRLRHPLGRTARPEGRRNELPHQRPRSSRASAAGTRGGANVAFCDGTGALPQ